MNRYRHPAYLAQLTAAVEDPGLPWAALAGKRVGETVQVAVPAGTHTLRIESITR